MVGEYKWVSETLEYWIFCVHPSSLLMGTDVSDIKITQKGADCGEEEEHIQNFNFNEVPCEGTVLIMPCILISAHYMFIVHCTPTVVQEESSQIK